jgi:GT2 family glycosyltransferase
LLRLREGSKAGLSFKSSNLKSKVLAVTLPSPLRRILQRAIRSRLTNFKASILSLGLSRPVKTAKSPEEAEASEEFSIIIPIHDAPEVTDRCLASVLLNASRAEIILVDDGSVLSKTQDVIDRFQAATSCRTLRNAQPQGHSAACAVGSALATRPYLCLLNSDTVVTPSCWVPLKKAFEGDPKIGVIGPSTSMSGTMQQAPVAFYCRHYWSDAQIVAFASRCAATCAEPLLVDLEWISGFALCIRRSLWEMLGGFDPNLPDYGNEVDLCRRGSNAGFRNVWVRNSYIHHLGRQSYDIVEARIDRASEYIRNKHSSRVAH